MSKTIAMTGATGFAGRHVVAEALQRGHRVVALVRDPARALLPPQVELVAGDLAAAAALARLTACADSVIHLAGALSGLTPADYFRVNAEGTAALARAAAAVPRFIHVSSLAARQPQLSPYGASKRAGEDQVRALIAADRLLIVRPPAVYGPGDRATLPLLKALTASPALAPGTAAARFSLLHVGDLARALVDAAVGAATGLVELSDGRAGGYGWADLARIAGEAQGRTIRLVYLPRAVPEMAAMAAEFAARLTGRPGMVSRGKIAELYHPDWVASGPGLPLDGAITFERGFPETLRWYRQEGWLPMPRRTDRSGAAKRNEAAR